MKTTNKWAAEFLPAHYDLYERIDLASDKKAFKAVCIWSIIAMIVMIVYGAITHSFMASFDMETWRVLFCVVAMAVGLIAYIVLHEAVHGIFIKLFTGEAPSFGMDLSKGMAYAGSTWLFKKWPYIIIALAPVVIWGAILVMWLKDIPAQYYWYLYAIQIFNITGAAGDFYVTIRVAGMPDDILAKDDGMTMEFYRPNL
ncbi:MAG: DUF3267 domain-containing protein [Firmicutes bacterium]|nr:DUF3267 domain-containing protein [Bacillota bacterium]